jgi:exo-beta-1,3-glucanase (GH17 family)
MMEDMRVLRGVTPAIRFYGLSGTQSLIPKLARANGLKCYAGAWIDADPVANAAEIAELKKIAGSRRATGVVVGNEVLQRRTLSSEELVSLINDVKSVSKVPVGYADSPTEWLKYPEVAAAVDFLFVHIHPFWDRTNCLAAADHVRQRWQDVTDAYPGKPVIVAETGWPSAGPANDVAVPGPENQRVFLQDFVPIALKEGIQYFLFEAFDELWKVDASGLGAESHWGLFQSNRQVKPDLQGFFSNPPPLIDITRPASSGAGGLSYGTIAGRVYGIPKAERKNYVVLVYAGTDKWYVQPLASQPFIRLRSNLTWGTPTHLGYEYVALLVRLPFEPVAMTNGVPSVGGNILAVCRSAPKQ